MKIPLSAVQIASMLYIEVPIIIFFFGWIRPEVSFPLLVLIAIQLIFYILNTIKNITYTIITIPNLIAILIVCGLWVLLSGAGHRGIHAGDFAKHNAILNDLIRLPWPVTYNVNGSEQVMMLVYYVAYYLPAALLGKFFGWVGANVFLYFWTYIGISLIAFWFIHFFKQKAFFALILFILLSGLDGLGRILLLHKTGVNPDWEWWAGEWQYSSITTLLFYVPQHALGAWVVVSYLFSKKNEVMTMFASLLLWSPFVWFGTLPFVIYQTMKKNVKLTWIDTTTATFIALICGAYVFSSSFAEVGQGVGGQWLWQRLPLFKSLTLVRLVFFYLFEFGICFGIIMSVRHFFRQNTSLLWIAVLVLTCIPWYRVGLLNDFAMRTSIPALYVVALYFISAFVFSTKIVRNRFIVYTVIGMFYPLLLMYNGAQHIRNIPPQYTLSELDTPEVRIQYLGKLNTSFYKIFAKNQQDVRGVIKLEK